MKPILNRKRSLGLLAFSIGLALLAYVTAQYRNMYMEQRRLVQEWQKEKNTPVADQHSRATTGLALLQIPKISLDAVVVEGTSRRKLAIAPGHMTSTSVPGEPGNAVITAHRDTFFRHIYELQKGDSIIVQRNGKTFTFDVTGSQVVPPDDLSVIRQSTDTQLTLITCYPTYYIGPAPERLVVFSKLHDPATAPVNAAHNSTTSEKMN